MIGIGLRTDLGTIEFHTDLFEHWSVRGPESPGLHHVIAVGQFERQLNLKEI